MLAGLLLTMLSQTPGSTLDQIPALAKRVTFEERVTTLTGVTQFLYKTTGVAFKLPSDMGSEKVTILVKDIPAWRLAQHLCTFFDLKPQFDGKRVFLDLLDGVGAEQAHYFEVEDKMLFQRAYRRVNALAKATLQPISTGVDETFEEAAIDRDDKTLGSWASSRVREAPLYAVGVAVRTHPYPATEYTSAAPGVQRWIAYRLDAPNTAVAAREKCRSLDKGSSPFRGTQILLAYDTLTGVFKYASEDGPLGKPIEPDMPLIRWPKPIGALADTNYGKRLKAWETDVPENEVAWKIEISNATLSSEPNPQTLTDRLIVLHQRIGIPVIADYFRVPTRARLSNVDSFQALARTLRNQDDDFVRCERDAVLIRHGGFWRLKVSEPDDDLIAKYENLALSGPLSMEDYAILASRMTETASARFAEPGRFVANFDLAPLQSAFWALKSIGELSANIRAQLWSGTPSNLKNAFDGDELDSAEITGTISAPPISPYAVEVGMLWGAQRTRHYEEILEHPGLCGMYLKADNRYSESWASIPLSDSPVTSLSMIHRNDDQEREGLFFSLSRDVGMIFWVKRTR